MFSELNLQLAAEHAAYSDSENGSADEDDDGDDDDDDIENTSNGSDEDNHDDSAGDDSTIDTKHESKNAVSNTESTTSTGMVPEAETADATSEEQGVELRPGWKLSKRFNKPHVKHNRTKVLKYDSHL